MKMKKLSFLCVAALLFASCASEDATAPNNNDKQQQGNTEIVATFIGSQPRTSASAKTRTTATHELGKAAKVFWEDADRIWVKADDGIFYQSLPPQFSAASPIDKSNANFGLTGGSYLNFNPEVRYTNTGSPDVAEILSTQSQNSPNDFSHLATAGDCGSAIAIGGGGDHKFTLIHKASYLCFLPRCMNAALGPNIELEKISVSADKPIAGKYDFSDGSLLNKIPTANSSNTITLSINNFPLDNTATDINKNGAYMVIAPGTYNFSITYTFKDNNGEVATMAKSLDNFTCAEGNIYDITANLTPKEFNYKHYMWDAPEGQDYWHGHESDRPTVTGVQGANYPLNNTDLRWQHADNGPAAILTATRSGKDCPNANEAAWYSTKGEVRSGSDVYAKNGHLIRIKGFWLKKKAAIIRDTPGLTEWRFSNRFPDAQGTDQDFRTYDFAKISNTTSLYLTTPIPTSKAADYFFLPALGEYSGGYFLQTSDPNSPWGYFWTSTYNGNNSLTRSFNIFVPVNLTFYSNFVSCGVGGSGDPAKLAIQFE